MDHSIYLESQNSELEKTSHSSWQHSRSKVLIQVFINTKPDNIDKRGSYFESWAAEITSSVAVTDEIVGREFGKSDLQDIKEHTIGK